MRLGGSTAHTPSCTLLNTNNASGTPFLTGIPTIYPACCREGMRLGGSTAAHAAVVGVGGVPGLAFGGGKYRCGARECAIYVLNSAATWFRAWGCCWVAAGLLRLPRPLCPNTLCARHVPQLPLALFLCRCPGRYFAEAELALIASLLLLLFDWRLLPRQSGAAGAAAAAPGSGTSAATPAAPGDPAGLLPPPDLRKLVGIKVPAGPCWVEYQRRQLGGS